MPDPPEPSRSLVCEFCECRLATATGEVLSRSKKARAMIELDDDNAALREQVTALETQVSALRAENDTLKANQPNPAPAPALVADDDDWS